MKKHCVTYCLPRVSCPNTPGHVCLVSQTHNNFLFATNKPPQSQTMPGPTIRSQLDSFRARSEMARLFLYFSLRKEGLIQRTTRETAREREGRSGGKCAVRGDAIDTRAGGVATLEAMLTAEISRGDAPVSFMA